MSVNRRRCGGDPKAARRTERNEAVRALGALLSAELSLERQVREIIRKVRRYRPAAGDENGDGEFGVLHQLANSGLPLPGTRQLKRILGRSSDHPIPTPARQNFPLGELQPYPSAARPSTVERPWASPPWAGSRGRRFCLLRWRDPSKIGSTRRRQPHRSVPTAQWHSCSITAGSVAEFARSRCFRARSRSSFGECMFKPATPSDTR